MIEKCLDVNLTSTPQLIYTDFEKRIHTTINL